MRLSPRLSPGSENYCEVLDHLSGRTGKSPRLPGRRPRAVCYGSRRDTALNFTDSVAFMDRIVVMPRMAPVIARLTLPSWFTGRKRLAAFSGVSVEGVVPEAIGTAPPGACPVSARPWITLAKPLKVLAANKRSLARARLRVCSSISAPESPNLPGNQVAAEAMNEPALMALKRFHVVFKSFPRSDPELMTSRFGLSAALPKTEPPKLTARPQVVDHPRGRG
jgi:hypothetical protein